MVRRVAGMKTRRVTTFALMSVFAVVFAGVDFCDFAAQEGGGGDSHSVVNGAFDVRGESVFGVAGEFNFNGGLRLGGLGGVLQDAVALGAAGFGDALHNHLRSVSAASSAQLFVVDELPLGKLRAGKRVLPLAVKAVDEVVPIVHMHFQREEVGVFGEDLVHQLFGGGAGVAALGGE